MNEKSSFDSKFSIHSLAAHNANSLQMLWQDIELNNHHKRLS